MRIIIAMVVFAAFASLASAGQNEESAVKLEPAKFLEIARRPPIEECWAKMRGAAIHKRAGLEIVEAQIYFGVRFTPERTLAQIVAGENESYIIGQEYSENPESTSIIAKKPQNGKSILADFGLRPDDLTLSFLYWPLRKELSAEEIKGVACRVLSLGSPDKKESANVFISVRDFFPLKVEWFKEENSEKKIYRTMEVNSFRKEENFWLVNSLIIYGPGWKTKIEFSESSAGFSKDGTPADLFEKP